ncbi:hypothetical protein WICMUC_002308 [Wickerhamomyces mucosus]|uniref:Uncharacterized protein n=1 Tax=Wickerhamomyces mucosus TaxID=1378264 RepID=A0A9P8PQ38_9ASCO|nr:hypothetical protein WICMUC_002308 [Wickerhamomyces mucosus]
MGLPSDTTVIFSNFPNDWIVGIDLQFFNSSHLLRGIKLIPDGIHVVHFAQDSNSIRSGFYFEAKENEVIILYWNEKDEKMYITEELGELNVSKELSKLPQSYPYMIQYPEDQSWEKLTNSINIGQVNYILPHKKRIDSVITSIDENNLLLDALQKSAQNRNLSKDPIIDSIIDQTNEEIKYTLIDFNKSIRPNSTPEQKTRDALDKTWFLNHTLITSYNSIEILLLSEFQQSFLNMVIFANYSSSIQWLKFLKIFFNCKDILNEKPDFFNSWIDIINLQFEKIPEDYFNDFIEEEFIKKSIGEFDYTVKELNIHRLVKKTMYMKSIIESRFGIIIQGIDDEEDEEGPVIVEL